MRVKCVRVEHLALRSESVFAIGDDRRVLDVENNLVVQFMCKTCAKCGRLYMLAQKRGIRSRFVDGRKVGSCFDDVGVSRT